MNIENEKIIVNNVIENEFNHIIEVEQSNMMGSAEYLSVRDKCDELFKEMKVNIPSEFLNKLFEYESLQIQISTLEKMYCFKKGVKAGLSSLEFLKLIEMDRYL